MNAPHLRQSPSRRKAGRKPLRRDPERINLIFSRFQGACAEPKSELVYTDPFTLLVAVVLSAQATDASVNKATPALFQAAPSPAAMASLGEEGIREHIKSIGLYRTKAKALAELSRLLVREHNGIVPQSREALEALPGVGRKTANVVLNIAFGHPTLAVDTHIFRVSNRTGLSPGRTVREVEEGLLRVIPERYLQHAHHWLILHGRYVCKARRPECGRCLIQDLCDYDPAIDSPAVVMDAR